MEFRSGLKRNSAIAETLKEVSIPIVRLILAYHSIAYISFVVIVGTFGFANTLEGLQRLKIQAQLTFPAIVYICYQKFIKHSKATQNKYHVLTRGW